MTAKSRHGRGKHSSQGKGRKSSRRSSTTVAQQPAMAQTHEPVSRSTTLAPSVNMPTPMAKSAAVQYPYIATELRFIGVLAGIMLIILVVLALVLS